MMISHLVNLALITAQKLSLVYVDGGFVSKCCDTDRGLTCSPEGLLFGHSFGLFGNSLSQTETHLKDLTSTNSI